MRFGFQKVLILGRLDRTGPAAQLADQLAEGMACRPPAQPAGRPIAAAALQPLPKMPYSNTFIYSGPPPKNYGTFDP